MEARRISFLNSFDFFLKYLLYGIVQFLVLHFELHCALACPQIIQEALSSEEKLQFV